jgi:hypothetical protein
MSSLSPEPAAVGQHKTLMLLSWSQIFGGLQTERRDKKLRLGNGKVK